MINRDTGSLDNLGFRGLGLPCICVVGLLFGFWVGVRRVSVYLFGVQLGGTIHQNNLEVYRM